MNRSFEHGRGRGGGFGHHSGQRREEGKDEVIEKIEKLENLADLKVEDFAPEDGYAHKKAQDFGRNMKTSQLRKFFDAVKSIKDGMDNESKTWQEVKNEFYLLQPQLAYARGRELVPEGFYRLMSLCMRKIDRGDEENCKKNYKRFVEFLEAIVAYSKYEGKRRGG